MLAVTTMIVSPCAAQMPQFEERGVSQRGAAVGAYFRIPFEGRGGRRSRPQLGMRVTSIQSERDYRAPTTPIREAEAFDLRLSGMAKPTLLIAGRQVLGQREERVNLSTGATIALAAGGLGLLLLVAVVAAGPGFPDCEPVGGNSDHCI